MTRRLAHLAFVSCLLAGTAACAKTQAQTPSPDPPVDAPEQPIETAPVTVDPAVPPATDPPATPPVEPTPPVTKPPNPPPEPTRPTPVLTPANVAALEKETRDLMARAEGDLAKVEVDELSRAARDQFESANRFLRLAGEALESRNYVYARQLADNAATLAAQLIKLATFS